MKKIFILIGLILSCSVFAQLDITKRNVTVTQNFHVRNDSVLNASEVRGLTSTVDTTTKIETRYHASQTYLSRANKDTATNSINGSMSAYDHTILNNAALNVQWEDSVRTSSFTVSMGKGYRVDNTNRSIDITIPSGQSLNSIFAVKAVEYNIYRSITVLTSGTNVFDKIGSNVLTKTLNQKLYSLVFQYTNTNVWNVVSSGISLPNMFTGGATYIPVMTSSSTAAGTSSLSFSGSALTVATCQMSAGSVAGNANNLFLRTNGTNGIVNISPLQNNTAIRLYTEPKGTPTGTTSKRDWFNTQYTADGSNYNGGTEFCNNTTRETHYGNNHLGNVPHLSLTFSPAYEGSSLQTYGSKLYMDTMQNILLRSGYYSTTNGNIKLSTYNGSTFEDGIIVNKGYAYRRIIAPDSIYPVKKDVDKAIDFALTGTLESKGNWSVAGGTLPSSGVLTGDKYTITNGTVFITPDSFYTNDVIIAKIDNPGQTVSNWNHIYASQPKTVKMLLAEDANEGVIKYTGKTLVDGAFYSTASNPLNSSKYLKLNSIFTATRGEFISNFIPLYVNKTGSSGNVLDINYASSPILTLTYQGNSTQTGKGTFNGGLVSTGVPLDSSYIKFTKGTANTNIGFESGKYNTTGIANASVGYNSGKYNTTGSYNSNFGVSAGANINTGSYNSNFGESAGANNITGSYNIHIGLVSKKKWNSDNTLMIDNKDDSISTFIAGDMSADTLRMNLDLKVGKGANYTRMLNGDISTTGDITYKYRHLVAGFDSLNYTIGGTQNIYYKINGNNITVRDTLGITLIGDSVKIQKAGDYDIYVNINCGTSNTSDYIRFKIYKNAAPLATSVGRFIIKSSGATTAATTEARSYRWYIKGLAANDILSFRATNLSANRSIFISDFKVMIYKIPE